MAYQTIWITMKPVLGFPSTVVLPERPSTKLTSALATAVLPLIFLDHILATAFPTVIPRSVPRVALRPDRGTTALQQLLMGSTEWPRLLKKARTAWELSLKPAAPAAQKGDPKVSYLKSLAQYEPTYSAGHNLQTNFQRAADALAIFLSSPLRIDLDTYIDLCVSKPESRQFGLTRDDVSSHVKVIDTDKLLATLTYVAVHTSLVVLNDSAVVYSKARKSTSLDVFLHWLAMGNTHRDLSSHTGRAFSFRAIEHQVWVALLRRATFQCTLAEALADIFNFRDVCLACETTTPFENFQELRFSDDVPNDERIFFDRDNQTASHARFPQGTLLQETVRATEELAASFTDVPQGARQKRKWPPTSPDEPVPKRRLSD
ncbi:hypothetical protein C8J57DRAFT_413694 [Mycena rebaudengoi]|nr:hypothetical protein C8J57DRAFT_413694 [Mycena rebaudengoi]